GRVILSLDAARSPDGAGLQAILPDERCPEPERALLHQELETAVADGLAELPVAQRAALEMKSLGHSLREIADALEATPDNPGVLVHGARQALARHLAPYLEEKSG